MLSNRSSDQLTLSRTAAKKTLFGVRLTVSRAMLLGAVLCCLLMSVAASSAGARTLKAPPLPGSKDVVHHGAGPSILGATTGPRRLSPAGSGISGHTVSSKHPGIDLNTLKHAPPVPVAHVLRRGNKLMPAAGPNWNLPWVNSGYGYASGYAWAGKLWVQHPNGAWGTCSASVVGYRLLATAAHCVRDHDTGQWNTAYLFEPGLNGSIDNPPYGMWWGHTASTFNGFVSVRDWRYGAYDYAFIKMDAPVGARTGYVPIVLNGPMNGWIFHTGYPAFGCSGRSCSPWYCLSPIGGHQTAYFNWEIIGLSCNTGPGSSGGPYLEYWNGGWYQTAVQSVCAWNGTSCTGTIWGPRFNTQTQDLINWASTH